MAYRCPMAITGGAREAIRCKASGSVCAHQKMCMMEGRIVLTAGAMDCPGRGEAGLAAVHPDIPADVQMNAEARGRNMPDASEATDAAAAPDTCGEGIRSGSREEENSRKDYGEGRGEKGDG